MQPMPEDWDRAVAVAAHPDDLEYGVAAGGPGGDGQGKHVSYLLTTRGEAGIAGMFPDQVGPLRVEEERRSAVVGVAEVEFLDHTNGWWSTGSRCDTTWRPRSAGCNPR